jgi:Cytidylate kinase-like family
MNCSVVCIAWADGAGGREIGGAVADELGYRLVDEAIVATAAREAGVEPHVAADAERRKSFARRLLDDLSSSGGMAASASLGAFLPFSPDDSLSADLRALIRAAVEETADRGSAVILAHGASFALSGRPDTLRVLVTADPATRRRRLAAERGVDESEAAKLVDESDGGRAAYLKRFYGVDAELPTHYDLVVNTDRVQIPQAAGLVARTAADWHA